MSAPKGLHSRLLRLAAPVAVSRLGIMGMGVCDTVVVGQFAPHDLARLALGLAPMGPFLVGGIGLLTGVQVLAARSIGQGAPGNAGAVFRRGVILAWIAGAISCALVALFAASMLRMIGIAPALADSAGSVAAILALQIPLHLTYVAGTYFMEALSRPGPGAAVMWMGNLVNLALNLWLVPVHGAVGSACATVGARLFLALAMTGWIMVSHRTRPHGVTRKPSQTAPGFDALLKVGAAAAVSQVAEAGAFSAMTFVSGRISETAVATFQISLNILAVIFMIALGFAAATQVLVSEYIGARQADLARRAGWIGTWVNGLCMIVAGLLAVVLAHALGRTFTSDAAIIAALVVHMPLIAVTFLPDGAQVVAAAALRGRGDNWFPTASHVFAYVIIMPPLAFWLAEGLGRGVGGVLEAILLASVVSAGVLLARIFVLTRPGSSPLPA